MSCLIGGQWSRQHHYHGKGLLCDNWCPALGYFFSITNRLEKVKILDNTIVLERAAEALTFGSN
jgi:hypothetical protein